MSFESQLGRMQLKPLNEDAPTPLYYQLYTVLKQNILNGTLENGTQLPTELGLSDAFGISRITAKRALDELATEGLVSRRRAKGTHVTYKYQPKPVKAPLVGMLQEIESMARQTEARVLDLHMGRPEPDIAKEFELQDGEHILAITRVRSRDGEPFAFYSSWSKGLDDLIDKHSLETTPRLEVFRQYGIQIGHVTQVISATAASEEVARELMIEPGQPLLSLIRRSFDHEEKLVDYLDALYHPDRFQYHMDLKPEQSD